MPVGLFYLAVSFVYFGARIVTHPGRALIGTGRDPEIFVWSFAWYLHAIETWQNPFHTHVIYAPYGINLAWTTTMPGLAFAFAPVTALFGPDVSYNLAAILAPACSAFTAYLLCRYVTRSLWPSLVGGYLFGFSSYILGQAQGHLHMTTVFLVPLIALVALRYLRGEIDRRGFSWRIGVLFGLQLWLSTELAVTAAAALAIGLALAYVFLGPTRARIRHIWLPLLTAVGLAALISAPLLYFLAGGFESGSLNLPSDFDADLLNFVVPEKFVWAGGHWFLSTSTRFRGGSPEAGAYLGIPTLVIIAWYATSARRSTVARYLLAALAVGVILTLGTAIVVRNQTEFWLPLHAVAGFPVLDNVLPARLALYVSLIAAVIVALWTAHRTGWARWLLPALAVAALAPDLSRAYYVVHPARLSFFTDDLYKRCVPQNENLLIFPYGVRGDSTLWQAETNFWFRIPEGYLRPGAPAHFVNDPFVQAELFESGTARIDQILVFVHGKHVDRIASVESDKTPTRAQIRQLGTLSSRGGMYIAPGCGPRHYGPISGCPQPNPASA